MINFWQRPSLLAKYDLLNQKQKREVINKLIDRELYLEIAKRDGIERDSLFMSEMDKLKENLMLDIWMKKSVDKIEVSKKEALDYYLKNPKKFHRPAVVKARHILVSTKGEAEDIIERLERSSNLESSFIELAKRHSTGPSAKNGGDLGWFSRDQMLPEFSNAVFSLKRGAIAHPLLRRCLVGMLYI